MDIVVKCRNTAVDEQFRASAREKLDRFGKLDSHLERVDVAVTQTANAKPADARVTVELTCHTRGSGVRARAAAGDAMSALDLALDKIGRQLHRAADRRRVHYGAHAPISLATATRVTPAAEG